METLHKIKPRSWYILASGLYLFALLQNLLMPVGDINVIVTAVLSLSGSIALMMGLFLKRLKTTRK